jgi:hypothetical protein
MGRKEKTVDGEMFIELAAYYTNKNEKDLVDVAETELFGYARMFSERSTHFEPLKTQRDELVSQNPDADEAAVWNMLKEQVHSISSFSDKELTKRSFYKLRDRELGVYREYLERGKGRYTLTFFNNHDIEDVNKNFQALSDETRKKLKGRLRKRKHKTAHRFSKKTYGIDIDSGAYQSIRLFSERYGLQTLSSAIIVMSSMAESNYEENALKTAFKQASTRLDISEEELFKKNKYVAQALQWIRDGQLYFSISKYQYYLNVSLQAEEHSTEVCMVKISSLISQLRSSERIVIGDDKHEMSLIGTCENGTINPFADTTEIEQLTLPPVYMANDERIINGVINQFDDTTEIQHVTPQAVYMANDERIINAAITKITEKAITIFNNEEKANDWLNKPRRALGWVSPKEAIQNGRLNTVNKMLREIDYGSY